MRWSGNGAARDMAGLFPLPAIFPHKASSVTPESHVTRSRFSKRTTIAATTNAAIAALNHLAGCPLNIALGPVHPALGATHKRIISHLVQKVTVCLREVNRATGNPIDPGRWNFDYITDLHDLLDEEEVLAPDLQKGAYCRILPDRLSLPGPGVGAKVDLTKWLPPEELDPNLILKELPPEAEELARIPIVKAFSEKDYPGIVARLVEAHVCGVSPVEPTCINGIFAVRKDNDWDRFILDGRRGNLFFKTPPKVRLPNLADLSRIVLLADSQLFTAKADMSNQFFMIRLPPEFQKYYGLPSLLIDEKLSELTGFEVGTKVWPHMIAVPMGASWAVNWAQKTQTNILSRSFTGTNVVNQGQLRVGHGLPPLWLSYIDDFHAFAAKPNLANQILRDGIKALEDAGFVENPQKRLEASHERYWSPVLGAQVSIAGIISPDPAKLAETLTVTRNLTFDRVVSTKHLTQVLGVWVWFLLLNRPFLSILEEVCKFVDPRSAPDDLWLKRKMPDSVCLELALLINVAPLLFVDLRSPPHDRIFASDASQHGIGAAFRKVPANFDPFAVAERSGWYSKHREDVPVSISTHPSVVEVCADEQWYRLFAVEHRDGQFIVLREALAALAVAARLALDHTPPTRVLLLIDSSSLLGAFAKGRSSSMLLNAMCRLLAATETIAECRLLFSWVRTNINPADEPSRLVPDQ